MTSFGKHGCEPSTGPSAAHDHNAHAVLHIDIINAIPAAGSNGNRLRQSSAKPFSEVEQLEVDAFFKLLRLQVRMIVLLVAAFICFPVSIHLPEKRKPLLRGVCRGSVFFL
jgi:hypothetical protein